MDFLSADYFSENKNLDRDKHNAFIACLFYAFLREEYRKK
jgi:hypothetical protein